MASDWKEGERITRTITNIAAEKNPENLVIRNIFLLFIAPSSVIVSFPYELGERNPWGWVLTCAHWRFLIFHC